MTNTELHAMTIDTPMLLCHNKAQQSCNKAERCKIGGATASRHFITLAAAFLLAVSLLASPRVAAQADSADSPITMNMRNADIRNVIQWVADLTGKNILVHNEVKGKVTVISSGPVSKQEAYELFLSALRVNGFAAQEKNGVINIVPEKIAAQGQTPFQSSSDSEVVTRILPVKNISASQLTGLLRPLLPEHSQLSADASSNSLIVVDRADNIEKIEQILARMDKPDGGAIDVVRLQHANANDVLDSLNSLVPGAMQTPGGEMGVRFSVDDRSNSVLIYGEPARRKKMRDLVRKLDQPVNGDGSTQVIYLNYVDAAELVPILDSMAGAKEQEQGRSLNNVTVNASESTNALVINAPPSLMADMKRVVSQIDIRKAQVLIEAMVVQVNTSAANDIGVSWITSENVIGNPDGGVLAAGNTLGNLPLAVVSDAITGQPNSLTNFNPAAGVTFGFFKNGSLRAAIRALASNANANILSTPTIIALDNEEAELLVGQSVPFVTGQTTSNAATTADPFTTIERQDIGTALRVTPRINQGDSIALKIEQTTESIDQSVDPAIAAVASDLITRKTEMRTRALIKDGEVLVIGGLISEEERERKQKVPVLGDIPVLGRLFSSKGVTKTKNNLMVFIHPVILKDAAHRHELTSKRYNFMREQQQKFGKGNEWLRDYKFKPLLPELELIAPSATTSQAQSDSF